MVSLVHILIIEDESKAAHALAQGFGAEGFHVVIAETGNDAVRCARDTTFDLVILDLGLPDRDGLDVLSALRALGMRAPVLAVTARDGIADRVAGLDAGADDYVVKPYSFAELLARVRALLRRGRATIAQRLVIGDLALDVATRRVARGGQQIALTAREHELLEYLMRHAGRAVSRTMLARDVWGEGALLRATPIDNVIDVQVARLRKKIDGPFQNRLLHTLRGVGFVLSEQAP